MLHLARTSKSLRSIVLAKGCRPAWIASLATLDSLPACPRNMNEPYYAALLFDHHCFVSARCSFRESADDNLGAHLVTVMRGRPRAMGGLRNSLETLQDLSQGEVSGSTFIYARPTITDGLSWLSSLASEKGQRSSRRTTWISSAHYLSSLVKLDLVRRASRAWS